VPDMPRFIEPSISQIHDVEQRYAKAIEMLDEVVDVLAHDADYVRETSGMTDGSALFQYMFSFIHHQHRTQPLTVLNTTAHDYI
jgi:hypothetical protein